MTPILARFVTAALLGAAPFVNLHPCAATAAERLESTAIVRDAGAADASASPVRRYHNIILYPVRGDSPWHRATRWESITSNS